MGKYNFKDEADFERTREEAERFYETIAPVHCPYFGEKVAFNAKGIRHLKFKRDEQARPRQDQYARFKLLPEAVEVLKNSKTLQGIWEHQEFEPRKSHGRWEKRRVDVHYYEFLAVIGQVRLKVVVKEVNGTGKFFYSVAPAWGIDKENGRRMLHRGHLDD